MTDQDRSVNDDAWDALARVAAGEGSPSDRAAAGRLIAGDRKLGHLVGMLDEVAPAPVIVPPSTAQVESALASVMARRDVRAANTPVVSLDSYRSRWRSARFRAAAAVLVVAGAGMIWRASARSAPEGAGAAPSRFATAPGSVDSIQLGDGTRVLLGPGSTLEVASGFGAASREVTLSGDARFTVVHDATRPFVVHTAAASFRDVGTVFVVRGAPSGGARVAVTEGAVAVTASGATDSVVLRAGDRAAVTSGAVRVERGVSTTDDVAWTAGQLVLRDASVTEVVSDVQRWYGMTLRVDSALAAHHVSATFERGAAPADVARVLAALLGGGVRQEGESFRIVAPPGVTPPR